MYNLLGDYLKMDACEVFLPNIWEHQLDLKYRKVVVENDITSSEFNHSFSEYSAGFETLGNLSILETAAGSEPFYFLIYDSMSSFTYSDQLTMDNKYSCLYN